MNGCQKARLQMSRKLDGVLPPAEDAALQAHLSACPACRTVWEQLCTLHQCLQEPTPTPAELHGAIMAKLAWAQQEPEQKRPARSGARRKKWIPALAGVAACGVLVVGAARFGLFRGAFSADNLSWSTGMAMAPSAADRDDDKSGSAGMDGFWPEENMDALAPSPEMPAEPPETADRETASPESQQKSSAASGADYLAQGPKAALPLWAAALLQPAEEGEGYEWLALEPEKLEAFTAELSQRGFTLEALREPPAEGPVKIVFLWD